MEKKYKHLTWSEVSRKEDRDYRIFKAYKVERTADSDGRKGEFVLVDSPDWVNIVAVVKNEAGVDCFLMVRQFRHGIGTVSLEFPAGLVDPGETPEHAAVRELREETGYEAEKMTLIGTANPNCAFMDNTNYTFYAENLQKIYKQELDKDEIIDVVLMPVDEAAKGFGKGELINAICILSHYWYLKMDRNNGDSPC